MRIKVNQNVTSYWLGKISLPRAEPSHSDRSEDIYNYKWGFEEPTSANASPSRSFLVRISQAERSLAKPCRASKLKYTDGGDLFNSVFFFASITLYRGVDVFAVVWVVGVSREVGGAVLALSRFTLPHPLPFA